MKEVEILNPWLLEKLQRGECVLFLGAGAVVGSRGPNDERAPRGTELRDMLAHRYLSGAHKDKPLTRVAEFAKYESSLADVQNYIREVFLPLRPAGFHKIIPSFRWHAIVTTNYDLVVERAYEQVPKRQQQLCPIIRDGDNFADVLKDQNALPYLKLHGCINTINDPNLPLILGSEEYARYRQNRTRLFSHFADWARERPVIFAGYDISDPNVQQILFSLTELGINRPTYAVVDPALDDIACRYWQAHRFVPQPVSFQSFLETVDARIPEANRILSSLRKPESISISVWFQHNLTPSNGLVRYLNEELEHVHPGASYAGVAAREFYAGNASSWAVFDQDLDQKRSASDDLIIQMVLEDTTFFGPRVYLLKGHAGSGKSVCLKRFAWDAAKDFGAKVLYLREGGVVRSDLILEILELARQPVVVIVDDAIAHYLDLNRLFRDASKRGLPLRLALGARTNEWNVAGTDFDFQVTEDFELKQLKKTEIEGLLAKLGAHNSLGELAHLAAHEQIAHFNLHSDRQLMVALHEATTGQRFHEIAYDEFLHVQPSEARTLYLDVCTLHRLGVSVRAGLISRISGITFERFSEKFFKPLEHVVHSYFDAASRDNAYKSRHQIIANFVFEQALPDPIERAAQITRMLRHMDTDYESDYTAFRQLIRGRTLAELFADKALVGQIFDAATESGASEDFICHQKAVFELHHPHGNMQEAHRAICQAVLVCEGKDRSMLHTKAIVLRRLALETDHLLEKNKYRADAKSILERLKTSSKHSHAFDTYGRLLLDELEDQLAAGGDGQISELTERTIADQIRRIEEAISLGLQKFPGDEHLLALDSDLAKTLDDKPRAFSSLKSAGAANPGRPFIAIRLASAYTKQGNIEDAVQTLRSCLELNPSSKQCHLEIAKILMQDDAFGKRQEIEYHLRRSFTEGDTNFDAHFWYARHEMLHGDVQKGLDIFSRLNNTRISSIYRNNVRGVIADKNGKASVFVGVVRRQQNNFCFVSVPELRFDVYLRPQALANGDWDRLTTGTRVKLSVGFTFRGSVAIEGATLLE